MCRPQCVADISTKALGKEQFNKMSAVNSLQVTGCGPGGTAARMDERLDSLPQKIADITVVGCIVVTAKRPSR